MQEFLSVDPEADMYPSISSYAYVADNPIMYIDPDGKEIILQGTFDEKKVAFDELQKLTNDKLTYDLNTGKVTIVENGTKNTDKTLSSGTALVSDLISHRRTLFIRVTLNASTEENGSDKDATNGKGTNACAKLAINEEGKVLTRNPKTGEIEQKETSKEILLGHELIHGWRAMEGQQVDYKKNESYFIENQSGECKKKTARAEELQTVGIHGSSKYTENKLRFEQGYGERIVY